MRRSNLMVLLGMAFFVLGGAIVLLVLRDDGSGRAEAAPSRLGQATVVAATEAVETDPVADDLVADIPEGMEALAVRVDFVAGAAGYVGAGDRVNLFAVIDKTTPADEGNQPTGPGFRTPRTELLLSNVLVLDVSSQVEPRRGSDDPSAPRPSGDALTYLLAVDTTQAARAIFATSFHRLHLTLVREDAPPAAVPGVDHPSLMR